MCVDLLFCKFTVFVYSISSFDGVFRVFYISTKSDSFITFFLIWMLFISFSCLISVSRTPSNNFLFATSVCFKICFIVIQVWWGQQIRKWLPVNCVAHSSLEGICQCCSRFPGGRACHAMRGHIGKHQDWLRGKKNDGETWAKDFIVLLAGKNVLYWVSRLSVG